MYLPYDALLGIGQLEGKALRIESVEEGPYMQEGVTYPGFLALLGIQLDAELYEKQFVELKPGHGS